MFNKKGQVMENLGGLAVGVAALVIVLAITFLVMSNIKVQTNTMGAACAQSNLTYNVTDNACYNTLNGVIGGTCNVTTPCQLSNAMNATQQLGSAADSVPGWVPLIILVSIGGLILVLVSRFR